MREGDVPDSNKEAMAHIRKVSRTGNRETDRQTGAHRHDERDGRRRAAGFAHRDDLDEAISFYRGGLGWRSAWLGTTPTGEV